MRRQQVLFPLPFRFLADYYLPCLVLEDNEDYHIGKYGRMHRAYLEEHRPSLGQHLGH